MNMTPRALPIVATRRPDTVLAPFTALASNIYLQAVSAGAAQTVGGTGSSHGGPGIGAVDHAQGGSLAITTAAPEGGVGGGAGGVLGNVGVTSVGGIGGAGGGGGGSITAGTGSAAGGGIRFRDSVGTLLLLNSLHSLKFILLGEAVVRWDRRISLELCCPALLLVCGVTNHDF